MYRLLVIILSAFIFVGCAADADQKTANVKNRTARLAHLKKNKAKKVNINPNGKKLNKRQLDIREKRQEARKRNLAKRKTNTKKNVARKNLAKNKPTNKNLAKRQATNKNLRKKAAANNLEKRLAARKNLRKKTTNKNLAKRKPAAKTYWDKNQKQIGYNNPIKNKLNRLSTRHTKQIKSLKNQGKWDGSQNESVRSKTLQGQNLEINKVLGTKLSEKKQKIDRLKKKKKASSK